MKENEWLRFEKSGRVSDYLTYCQSGAGKYSEYEMCRNQTENYGACGDGQSKNPGNGEYGEMISRRRRQDGADLYPDGNDSESRSCGRVR